MAWSNVSGRPTNVSSFTNDSGYLTSHQSLSHLLPLSGGTLTGHLKISGTKDLASVWDKGIIAGADGHDKIVATYLASSTNGAVVGAHNSNLSAWSTLNIAGTSINFRINETTKITIDGNGDLTSNRCIKSTYYGPAFLAEVAAGSWAYLRLKSGSILHDVAVNTSTNSGALELRYGGGDTNKTSFLTNGCILQYGQNLWLNPAHNQIGRPDATVYTDRTCMGATNGNLHLDAYKDKNLYLNYYSSKGNVYFNGDTYYINGGNYNGNSATATIASRAGTSVNWVSGRDYPAAKTTSISGYSSTISIKTTNGSWDIGAYDHSSYLNKITFSYVTDANYNARNNTSSVYTIDTNGYFSGSCSYANSAGSAPANGGTSTYTNYLKTRDTNVSISSSTWANNPWGASNMTVVWGQSGYWGAASADTADITLQYGNLSSAGGAGWFLNIDGGIYTISSIYAPSYYTNSDIRYKNIISNIKVLSEDIANLPLFTYTWNDGRKDCLIHVGSSAQDVEKILPNLVSQDNTGFRSLDYPVLGVVAGITACKELVKHESEIEKLKTRIKELEQKLGM